MRESYKPFQPTLTQPGLSKLGLSRKSRLPCDALLGIVHSYLQITAEKPTQYPIMPDCTQAIYISPQGSLIGGAQIEARDMQLLQPGEYFGIWFYPGALRHFFDLNLSEISGQIVDNSYFSCREFLQLHNEIYRHDDFHSRANVCEQWLLIQYSKQPVTKLDHALSLIYQSLGSEKVWHIANKVGWSSRHLNRQFLQFTGLNTKTFSQIVRA